MATAMTGGQYIARALAAHDVRHVFFMDAILRRALVEMEALGIARVLVHSEKAAAYMADGYARVARKPGVCMAQSVGAANLAAGLQDAFLGQSAVIALTGRQPAAMQYRNAYQEIPHEPLFASVTKASMRVDLPGQLPLLLRQAFRTATSGRPGPVHLDIAGHTGDAIGAAPCDHPVPPCPEYGVFPAHRTPADASRVERAVEMIQRAERPVLVADMGLVVSDAFEALRDLAEHLDIPVAASLDAKAVLPEGHRLNAGVAGTYSRACANRTLDAADLVIYAGSNVGDQVSNNWTLPGENVPVIQIDCDAAELGRNYVRTLGLSGDPRTTLQQLRQAAAPKRHEGWVRQVQQHVRQWREAFAPVRTADAEPIRPERLCTVLGELLPPDAILVTDTGYSSQWTGTLTDLAHEGQRYYRASGSLGWGFPASLGAKLAAPGAPVVCFTGDGGFMYHLPELETALRWKLNTITVVNNNSCLAQGARSIKAAYDGHDGNPEEIYHYRPMDFARIATAMGCMGIRVQRIEEFRDAFQQALAAQVPVVIDVVTDAEALAPLPWSPPSRGEA